MLVLVNAGYLAQREGRMRLSPRGVRKIGQLACATSTRDSCATGPEATRPTHRGAIDLRPEESKRYEDGDPLALDLVHTLKRALTRRPGTPLDLHPGTSVVYGSATDDHELDRPAARHELSMSWKAASRPPRRSRWRWRA